MVTYDIKERLLQFLEQEKITLNKLEELCGFSKRYLANANCKLPKKKIDVITNLFPNLNADWLLTGNGIMLSSGLSVISNNRELSINNWHSEILTRLLLVLSYERISPEAFEDSQNSIRKGALLHPNDEDLSNILNTALLFIQKFPEYSPSWIFYGEGMQKRVADKAIPVYQAAKLRNGLSNLKIYEYHISTFDYADCFVRVGSNGYSKSKTFGIGDMLACRLVDLNHENSLSCLYYLVCLNTGKIIIDYLCEYDENSIQFISVGNDNVPQFGCIVSKKDIVFIAEIVGNIRSY